MSARRLVAIEGGGTTWVAAVALEGSLDALQDRLEVPTTDPASTIGAIRAWLRERGEVAAIGVASFGPIDAKVSSATFGFITSTPKPGWANTDVVGLLGLRDEFKHVPFKFDTDVNAPALAEFRLYKKPGTTSMAYVTVGTGIGVGLVVNGAPVHGLVHPEGGHIQVARMAGDSFPGTCPFHKHCVEGMTSTGALALRAGAPAAELASLPDDHPVWDAAAYYLAQLCMTVVLTVSAERIVLGGGVMNRTSLYGKIRAQLKTLLAGYMQADALTTDAGLEEFVAPSVWGSAAGIVGAAYLAQEALR
jgi:fructokinase